MSLNLINTKDWLKEEGERKRANNREKSDI